MDKIFALLMLSYIQVAWHQCAFANEQIPWQLELSKEGMSLYSRKLKGSEYLQIKAIIPLNYSVKDVLATMPSGNQCWQWQKRCKLVQILQRQDLNPRLSQNQNSKQDEEFSRIVIDLPWPIKDRDFVFHSRLMVNTKLQTTTISLESITDFYPTNSHYIRGQANISYAIKQISDSKAILTIHMHTDFAGSLSPSIINAMLIDELYEDIKQLRVLLAKD